jgi:hypothetical protein
VSLSGTTVSGNVVAHREVSGYNGPAISIQNKGTRVEDFTLGAAIHVAYQLRDGIAVPVPVEMHELYENKLNGNKVEGTATYANFREFNVKINEEILPPAPPPR